MVDLSIVYVTVYQRVAEIVGRFIFIYGMMRDFG